MLVIAPGLAAGLSAKRIPGSLSPGGGSPLFITACCIAALHGQVPISLKRGPRALSPGGSDLKPR